MQVTGAPDLSPPGASPQRGTNGLWRRLRREQDEQPPAKQELDFIVIGAQKSATTTLFQYLRHHPEVALPAGKEAPFFSHDAVYERGWEPYLQALVRDGGMTDPERRWGTVTPQYMVGGVLNPRSAKAAREYDARTVPRRMHAQLPRVRLLAVLRDPVARAISHYGMTVRTGAERRSFDEAIEQLLEPAALEAARARPIEPTSYIVRGEYGRILEAYLEVFEREQLLVLFTDEFEREPRELLARVHRFIGVREDFVPPNLGERYLVGRPQQRFDWRQPGTWFSPSSPMSPQGALRGLRRVPGAQALWHTLPFDGQRRLLRPYQRLAGRTVARSRRRSAGAAPQAAPSAETIVRLREHFAADAERLQALLGGTAPYWERERARR